MSYDISFRVKVDGINRYVDIGDCDANITWNVGKIIRMSTGLEWNNEENNGLVKDVIPYIEKGRCELIQHPQRYKPYEAKNGWGTVEGTIRFFEWIIRDWEALLRDDEELANVATFWIM